jgi:hypothetical protein
MQLAFRHQTLPGCEPVALDFVSFPGLSPAPVLALGAACLGPAPADAALEAAEGFFGGLALGDLLAVAGAAFQEHLTLP